MEANVLISAPGAELSKLTLPDGSEIQFDERGTALVPRQRVSKWEDILTDYGMSVTDWPIPGHA